MKSGYVDASQAELYLQSRDRKVRARRNRLRALLFARLPLARAAISGLDEYDRAVLAARVARESRRADFRWCSSLQALQGHHRSATFRKEKRRIAGADQARSDLRDAQDCTAAQLHRFLLCRARDQCRRAR